MPDGSTTVVCAKPGQTSRSVLGKLCEKRSVSLASMDVFLLGADQVSFHFTYEKMINLIKIENLYFS